MKGEAATGAAEAEHASKDKRRKFWKLYRRKSLIIASPISSIIFARRRTKEIAAMCSVFFRGRLIACCFERRAVLARSLLLLFGTEKKEKLDLSFCGLRAVPSSHMCAQSGDGRRRSWLGIGTEMRSVIGARASRVETVLNCEGLLEIMFGPYLACRAGHNYLQRARPQFRTKTRSTSHCQLNECGMRIERKAF